MNKEFSITAGAFTKARKKLKHTAYSELNSDIIRIYYDDQTIKRLHGFRILSLDGSKIILPKSKEIQDEFGTRAVNNQTGHSLASYTRTCYQACYDVLNNIVVQSELGACEAYEVDLAKTMLEEFKENDLLIFDRGYASYEFMAALIENKRHFIIRFPKVSFKEVQQMFKGTEAEIRIVDVNVPKKHKKKAQDALLPSSLKIKLVRVVLSTGEIEVLATSLMDDKFTTKDFSHLYSLRWGVETFFAKIKGRLALENFTGKTVESVKQDFWSTIFISNLETIMTEDIESKMNEEKADENKPVKVNKAVSFNAIKKLAFEIFTSSSNREVIFEKLEKLFIMNPITVREGRKILRKKITDTKSLNFQKRMRKHVF